MPRPIKCLITPLGTVHPRYSEGARSNVVFRLLPDFPFALPFCEDRQGAQLLRRKRATYTESYVCPMACHPWQPPKNIGFQGQAYDKDPDGNCRRSALLNCAVGVATQPELFVAL